MALALSLGQRGQGCVWPNPAVGCVIVQGARIVGRGWTQPGGRPHAETMALAQAGDLAKRATVFVTLEPCAHHGATPPCAEALIAAGIARCVVAISDPDPRVSGKGIAKLQAAGIEVSAGCQAQEALLAHRGFFSRLQNGRPWVTLKLATSLDGRIATASGESQWITGAEARRDVHGLRACHDAVLVGGGTARADNPASPCAVWASIGSPSVLWPHVIWILMRQLCRPVAMLRRSGCVMGLRPARAALGKISATRSCRFHLQLTGSLICQSSCRPWEKRG